MRSGIKQCAVSEKAILMKRKWAIEDLYHTTSGSSEGCFATLAFGPDSFALLPF